MRVDELMHFIRDIVYSIRSNSVTCTQRHQYCINLFYIQKNEFLCLGIEQKVKFQLTLVCKF